MKTEEIMKRMKAEEAEKELKLVNKFSDTERQAWESWGKKIYPDDAKGFLKLIGHLNGRLTDLTLLIKLEVIQELVDYFTLYPKDCIDAWEVARIILEEMKKRGYDVG